MMRKSKEESPAISGGAGLNIQPGLFPWKTRGFAKRLQPQREYLTDREVEGAQAARAPTRVMKRPRLTRGEAQRLFRSHAPEDQSRLDFRPREFSGVQLHEVAHADRLLARKLEQVVGHAVVTALLV
jgi:hypothetical protein